MFDRRRYEMEQEAKIQVEIIEKKAKERKEHGLNFCYVDFVPNRIATYTLETMGYKIGRLNPDERYRRVEITW